jgi:hypothetical protein
LAGGGPNHTPLLPGLAVSGLKTESIEIDLLCELVKVDPDLTDLTRPTLSSPT